MAVNLSRLTLLALLVFGTSSLLVMAGDPDAGGNGNGNGNGNGQSNVNSRHLLLPPEDAENQDAKGDVKLKENPSRGAIHVLVKKLTAGETYDVTISEDGTEFESMGMITTQPDDDGDDGDDGDGDDGGTLGVGDTGGGEEEEEEDEDGAGVGRLRLDTKRGDELPLGAEAIADLVGAIVQIVNDSDEVVLEVEIVDLLVHNPGNGGGGPPTDDDGGDDGGDGGDAGGSAVGGELEPSFPVPGQHDASFVRGDADMDGSLSLGDPIVALAMLFLDGDAPYCMDAADSNDDGVIDLTDPIALLQYLFGGGDPLAEPGNDAGCDPTADALYCDGERDSGE